MKSNTFVTTLVAALVLLAVAFLLPGPNPPGEVWLPWQIERANGSTRVFGLTLGQSTLAEAEARFEEEAEVSLFATEQGEYEIEAYFDDIELSGLKAKVVIASAIAAPVAEKIYQRGTRVATLGSGTRKVTLHPDDIALVRRSPIASLTYLPRAHLTEELVSKRFGEPTQRVVEAESGVVHLLYPDKGLDIAISEKEREVLQYVPPQEFERLVAPLLELQKG